MSSQYVPQELLLTQTQIKKLIKAARDGTGVQIRLSKSQIHKAHIGHGFFGDLLKGAVKTIAPVAIDGLAGLAKQKLGGGRKRKPRKLGKGRFTDALKSAGKYALKKFAPTVIEDVCGEAKRRVNGMGAYQITNGHGIYSPGMH